MGKLWHLPLLLLIITCLSLSCSALGSGGKSSRKSSSSVAEYNATGNNNSYTGNETGIAIMV